MPEILPKDIARAFPAELRSLWSISLLSLVLGALALALGLSAIADAAMAMAGEGLPGLFRLVRLFTGWAALVIGFRWVMSAGRILKGVSGILRDYQALEGSARQGSTPGKESAGGAIPPGSLEALFLRMLGLYRADWKTWWKMRLVAAGAGWILIFLGVLAFIDGYPAWQAGGRPPLPVLLGVIPVALGIVAIFISSRFDSYARTWERRLIDAGQGEEIPREGGST